MSPSAISLQDADARSAVELVFEPVGSDATDGVWVRPLTALSSETRYNLVLGVETVGSYTTGTVLDSEAPSLASATADAQQRILRQLCSGAVGAVIALEGAPLRALAELTIESSAGTRVLYQIPSSLGLIGFGEERPNVFGDASAEGPCLGQRRVEGLEPGDIVNVTVRVFDEAGLPSAPAAVSRLIIEDIPPAGCGPADGGVGGGGSGACG